MKPAIRRRIKQLIDTAPKTVACDNKSMRWVIEVCLFLLLQMIVKDEED